MPCQYDSVPGENEARLHEGLDRLTRMLCWVCERTSETILRHNPELMAWWTEHQKADAKRKFEEETRAATELLKANALAKLSTAERKALGF